MLARNFDGTAQPAAILSLGFSGGTLNLRDFSDYVQDSANFRDFDTFRATAPGQALHLGAVHNLAHTQNGILINCLQAGEIQLGEGNRQVWAKSGDTLIADMAREAEFSTLGFDARCLLISKDLLANRRFTATTMHLQNISGQHTVAKMLNRHVCDLHANAHLMTEGEARALLAPTLSLLEAALNTKPEAVKQIHSREYTDELQKVCQFIGHHLYKGDLSVEMIAGQLGMSRAKLYRLTEQLGGIKRFIRQQRLKEAHKRLSDTGGKPGSIANLAYDLGFGSENTFRRSFKEVYGVSPRRAVQKNG